MQTTLLGLAITFIVALIAALIGPYFIDWNQFRPQFEAEATRVIGAPVRVQGALDARLLPSPSLRLRSVVVGGASDPGKVRADKLDVEFSLGSLMRGEWRATELTINGVALDLGLDARGQIDWPVSTGSLNLGSLSIDRLNLTGRVALHDAASRSTLELNDIAFSGDVRSLAGSIRGDGNFMLSGARFPFRISSGQGADGNGTRLHFTIDPGVRALSVDLDGILALVGCVPHFDGAITLASPAGANAKSASGDTSQQPWRLSAKLKADPVAARLEQLEASYGAEDAALKLAGLADIRFGASPLIHAVLSARQLDADRLFAKDNDAATPTRILPALRSLVAAIPQTPLATQIEVSAEQIMLGGRPIQTFGADVRGDRDSWTIDRLEFRAPGATRVALSGKIAEPGLSDRFVGALNIESSDPDTLISWLQSRGEITYRSQKPLRVRGSVDVASDRIAIDKFTADIDGGTVEGRLAFLDPVAGGGSRIEVALKADRLDLDAAAVFARSLAGSQAEWPDQGQLSLDIGRAVSAGQELRPFVAQLGYGPKTITLDHLKIGQTSGVTMEGAGAFNRADATGKLTLTAASASLAQITGLVAPIAPGIASRLNAMAGGPGAVRVKLALDLDKNSAHADRANAQAALDIDIPQLKGSVSIAATPVIAAVRAMDFDALRRSAISVETKLSAEQARPLLVLLGLDRAIASSDGPARFEGSATGMWHAPFRLKAKLSGADLDADAQGTAEPFAAEPKAAVNLSVHRANIAPLIGLEPSDTRAKNISLSSRLTLAGSKLTFDDLDSTAVGSRIRGRIAVTLGDENVVEGEVGTDTIDLASAFGLAVGAAGHAATEPLDRGLLRGWRGQLTFQALRGTLPGNIELRPVSGVLRGDGRSVTFDAMKGRIGGGDATAAIDARQTPDGVALNARVQLAGVDGTALHYRGLAMPSGRVSSQMTLTSLGRSASALEGALSGSGLVTLDSAHIDGLNARAFDAAISASDGGQVADDIKLRQIVEQSLSAGSLTVASAQIPFNVRDGRLRVDATTLEAEGARVIVSGGYDISADQADIRASLVSTSVGSANSRPEIQIFAAGSPDALNRTVDVAALSSWLAVRAIDRETRRLDSIERGEPPSFPLPAPSSGPAAASLPPEIPSGNSAVSPGSPLADVPVPSHVPRRPAPKPRVNAPHMPAAPQAHNAPVAGPQVAPLPAPIEVRPAPGATKPLRPRPPLVLTPPASNLPRPAF